MSLLTPVSLQPLLTAPIAVFGSGVSGDGVCALAKALRVPADVFDAKGRAFTADDARRHRLVVFSPGFAPDHPWLRIARVAGCECLGELEFATRFWRGAIIAITGTNGKTTMTEFLTHALHSIGREAHATGNIGLSFSSLVAALCGGTASGFAICEVSSFQAETLTSFQARAALWTNFAEDHLERHPGLASYFNAKWSLVEHTERRAAVFVGTSVQRHADRFGRSTDGLTLVATENQPADPLLADTVFAEYPQRENFLLVHAWWRAEGLDSAALYAAAKTFRLGRHRLTRVGEIRGVTFWNDSKATNFHAVEAALRRFVTPVVLIAGGKAKGGDLAAFVQRIAPQVHAAVLIGATAPELAGYCRTSRVQHVVAANLADAVRVAGEICPAGGHVLLSPGFASFDQFRNYEDRGEQFEKLVHQLPQDLPAVRRAATRV